MRWPLRYQIALPMAAVMLSTVVAVASLGAWLAVGNARSRIESQLREVGRLIEESSFPLTPAVLRQMKALSGAELVAVNASGRVEAASGNFTDVASFANESITGKRQEISWTSRVSLAGRDFFHAAAVRPPQQGGGATILHILYPVDDYRRAWQQAVFPSLGFAAVALPIVMLLAFATGSRIAGRVGRLHQQVDRIARGDFQPFLPPVGNDEIRSLAEAVNRMAAMLANYEEEVRRTERMRTLAHLGGGIAHQLRNSATGCTMAVDLHAAECPLGPESETLVVAKRQLGLMEEYIQRFLQLGKRSAHLRVARNDRPCGASRGFIAARAAVARHAGVELRWICDDSPVIVTGDAERLGQLVINLLINAIEAAAQALAQVNRPAQVDLEISRADSEHIKLRVSDSGFGPADRVRNRLFEPFVSEKPDGVGLGLSVAREIVEQHGGHIDWQRTDGLTHFIVELPSCNEPMENSCAASTGR